MKNQDKKTTQEQKGRKLKSFLFWTSISYTKMRSYSQSGFY